VRLQCRPPARRIVPAADDPLAECLRLAAELADDPDRLRAFADAALREMIAKLPSALRTGPASLGLDDPATLAPLLGEAEALLLERLGQGER